ncbi:MAG: UDP-2,3-diacylglucosamine diphosphatase [Proteobacteria bacterium]|nr:UDP-2,3-diacylglucosamine diphosphatase [Pseudomonadota bacterium]
MSVLSNTVFISDLHLAPERPQIIALFLRFADAVAAKADTLFILGDFVEYWLGDDDPAPALTPIFDKLAELSEKHGTRVFFMHGNRDFLIGEKLAERCHFQLIDEPYALSMNGKKMLLMHGDTLCTDDIEYQKFRQMVRSPLWKQEILSKSLEERIQIARQFREQSQKSTTEKEETIMDVNQQETDKVFIDNDITLLIHGHTHRPAIHHKTINGIETTRIVLGDWYNTGSYLIIRDDDNYADPELKVYT